MQTNEPAANEVYPAAHGLHCVKPLEAPYVPGGHNVHPELPASEYMPGGHSVAAVAPPVAARAPLTVVEDHVAPASLEW